MAEDVLVKQQLVQFPGVAACEVCSTVVEGLELSNVEWKLGRRDRCPVSPNLLDSAQVKTDTRLAEVLE